MAEDVHHRSDFTRALRDMLVELEQENVDRIDRSRVEEIGQQHGITPDEARKVFINARGTMWRGELVENGEEPGWEAAVLERVPPPGPVPVEEMSEEDRKLLENPAVEKVWELLAERYPRAHLAPETSPQFGLGIDSLEWVNLAVEIGQRAGVELDEEALDRIETVRDLLREVSRSRRVATIASPVEQPEEVLDEEQMRYLEPLSPGMDVMARGMFAFNRAIARGLFQLRVENAELLPEGQFVIAPNHTSYLDSFALAAALDYRLLRQTYWAAWTGAAFGNPINSTVSRLAKAVPIHPDQHAISSLAFGAAVLKRGKNLVWFPGGQRSPTGGLQQFKPGIGVLLEHFRVPVVPVVIRGTYEAMPPGKALPRPTKVTVEFGRPLDVDELERQGEGDRPEDRIIQALHDHIAEMIG